MNNYFFAASDNSFYCDELHAGNMPSDAKPVTEQVFREMLQQRSAGKIIVGDSDGLPVASDPPPPTTADLWAAHQAEAKVLLEGTSTTMERITEAVALGLNTFTGADVLPWMNYRRALRSIVSQKTVGDPTQPLPTKPSAYPTGT